MESTLICARIYTISVESTTLHFRREKPLLLKLMVSSWQNEILRMDYRRFQRNMESSVIDTKLKLKTENWIWSISASRNISAVSAREMTQNVWQIDSTTIMNASLWLFPFPVGPTGPRFSSAAWAPRLQGILAYLVWRSMFYSCSDYWRHGPNRCPLCRMLLLFVQLDHPTKILLLLECILFIGKTT